MDPLHLPISKYSNYSNGGKSFLLRKTNEGFSLYEETAEASDGLKYTGKIFVVEGVVFFEDEKEQRYIANFDTTGNLTVDKEVGKVTYSKNN